MTYLWTILGIAGGGGLGYLYGRWNRRRQAVCKAPTCRAMSGPWSGAISGALLGLLLVILIISTP